jgi:hypothetical protein
MKKYYKIFCLLVALCSQFLLAQAASAAANNTALLINVQKQLSNFTTLKGDFTQTRTLKLLAQPLVSRGHFVLSKANGLQWMQETPFKSNLLVSKTRIEQTAGDEPPTILTKKQQPIVFAFTNIFLSLFNGDLEQVKHYFSIDFSGDMKAWKIVLVPAGFPLDKAITSITLRGGKTVNTIIVDDVKGNVTKTSLFNVKGS